MIDLRRGYLYYLAIDKRRPALVISYNARNARAVDVLVIPCSTQLLMLPTHVRLRRGEGGLPSSSVLKCEQITNLEKHRISAGALGPPLSPARMRDVEVAVMRAIGIMVPMEP